MKNETFEGLFKGYNNEYTLKVYTTSMLKAFFLLTADAIRSGKHYQLYSITNINDNVTYKVGEIQEITRLFTYSN